MAFTSWMSISTCSLMVGPVATRPPRSSSGPRQMGLQRRHRHADRIPDPEVREFSVLAHPVDRRSAYAEEGRHVTDREERAHLGANLGFRRVRVQQGSSKILAQACMGLHIFAFLIGHTSRICTGLHVPARIRRYVNILYEGEGAGLDSSRLKRTGVLGFLPLPCHRLAEFLGQSWARVR